jgi:hypothetical protein
MEVYIHFTHVCEDSSQRKSQLQTLLTSKNSCMAPLDEGLFRMFLDVGNLIVKHDHRQQF